MDQYWNYVATPLFIFVLIFGGFVLFRVSATQLTGSGPIASVMTALRKPLAGYTPRKPPTAGPLQPAAAPAAPATAGK